MKKITSVVLATILAVTLGSSAFAGSKLSAAEVKALIVGKTAHSVHNFKGFEFKAYFTTDGKMIRKGARSGTYEIKANGKHCIDFGSGVRCAYIEKNKDGTYSRVAGNGKRPVTWKKIVDGKDF